MRSPRQMSQSPGRFRQKNNSKNPVSKTLAAKKSTNSPSSKKGVTLTKDLKARKGSPSPRPSRSALSKEQVPPKKATNDTLAKTSRPSRSLSEASRKLRNESPAKGKTSIDKQNEKTTGSKSKEIDRKTKGNTVANTIKSPRQTRNSQLDSPAPKNQSKGGNVRITAKKGPVNRKDDDDSESSEEETVSTPRPRRGRSTTSSPAVAGSKKRDCHAGTLQKKDIDSDISDEEVNAATTRQGKGRTPTSGSRRSKSKDWCASAAKDKGEESEEEKVTATRQRKGKALTSSPAIPETKKKVSQAMFKKQKDEELDSSDEEENVTTTTRQRRGRATNLSPGVASNKKKNSHGKQEDESSSSKISQGKEKQAATGSEKRVGTRSRSESVKVEKKAVNSKAGKSKQSECKTSDGNTKSEQHQKKQKEPAKASKVVSKKEDDKNIDSKNTSNNASREGTRRSGRQNVVVEVSDEADSEDEKDTDEEDSVVELSDSSKEEQDDVEEIVCDSSEDSDVMIDENQKTSILNSLLMKLNAEKAIHNRTMKSKDEELKKLMLELEAKDEELDSLKSAKSELEARISAILTDPKVYEKEVEKQNKVSKDRKPSVSSVQLKENKGSISPKKSARGSQKEADASEDPKVEDTIKDNKEKVPKVEASKKTPLKKPIKASTSDDEIAEKDKSEEEIVQRRSKRKHKDEEDVDSAKDKPKNKDKCGKQSDTEAKSPKKRKPSNVEETAESEEDEEEKSTKRKQRKRKSTVENETKDKKARRSRRKKKGDSEEEEDIDGLFVSDKEEEEEDSDGVEIIEDPKKPKEDAEEEEEESKKEKDITSPKKDTEDGEEDDEHKGRHNIRKLMSGKKLTEETKAAAKAEKDRRERVEQEHSKHLVKKEIDPKTKAEICTKLVLAFQDGTKKPAVEVLTKLVKKLKPHQVEAVEFMWDNLIESLDKLSGRGQGCILAHCMGLGKTLSVITFVHTLLTSKAVGMKTCLVVCPLNTVLNWQYEWEKWLDKKDRLPVYELASCRDNHGRAELLTKWQKSGGIMIIGYSLFRILASYTGKSKKVKTAFDEGLIDPGADVVICDEGHILKNDASALSKWMSKIRSQRRVVLTGTPLQNNLVEYHCMANFVKPQLLGTRREFNNRFVNPITNGQHSDSTARDVKLMKRRAHVLHEMLSGCVQRRDYSSLSKFLPPKEEYVISVRLSELQIKLYKRYLETFRPEENQAANQLHHSFKIRGASLFTDYQALMRVWTHPWVLKLDALRQERKAFAEQDDELDSLDESSECLTESEEEELKTEDEEEEEEMTEESSESEEEALVIDTSDQSSEASAAVTRSKPKPKAAEKVTKKEAKKKDDPKKKKKKTKRASKKAEQQTKVNGETSKTEGAETDTSVNSDTEKTKVLGGEVIRTWKTASRHGKQDAVNQDELLRKDTQWWSDLVDEERHKTMVELSGKLVLLFEILRMSEGLGDKVLVFSQSILSLDLIEEFLKYKDEEAQNYKGKKSDKPSRWVKDEDYYRMDGSTGVQNRRKFTNSFNTENNDRLRLFLISTRAGGLGINLDSANRVIIFDASWNPSHDIQSIFRVYRFGQEKDVYVYRFVAQGTMEEKIYDRQVTKETLSQRVIDEHQIDRHFTANDLQELYVFKPDVLDDPNRTPPPVPKMPKDLILTELLSSHKEWIYGYHEHDSLLENRPDENLTEEERKAAWEEYERDKQGIFTYNSYNQPRNYTNPVAPIIQPTIGGPATAQLSSLLTSMTPYSQPQINMQIQQLPRVVREILKYNPNITADELQVRLQSFLGMHTSRFAPSSQPGQPVVRPTITITSMQQQPSTSSINANATTSNPRGGVIIQGVPHQAVPAQGFLPRLAPATFPNPMTTLFPPTTQGPPSRLPTTGFVPAMGSKQPTIAPKPPADAGQK